MVKRTDDLKFLEIATNSSYFSNMMRDVTRWGPLKFTRKRLPLRFDGSLYSKDVKVYKGVKLTDELKYIIEKNIRICNTKLGFEPEVILFDNDGNPVLYRKNNLSPYIILDTDGWESFDFNILFNVLQKDDDEIIWAIGDLVFGLTKNRNTFDLSKALTAIILEYYCDKYIPISPENKYPMTKVTFDGFKFVFYYLQELLPIDVDISEATLSSHYEDLDKNKLIPIVPIKWNDKIIEMLTTTRLESIVKKLRTPQSDRELTKDLINMVENQIENDLIDKAKPNDTIKLSKVLSDSLDLADLRIWSTEYEVEIDQDIVVAGTVIPKDDILIAVFTYGVLEILLKNNSIVLNVLDELEDKIYEKYAVYCKFYINSSTNLGRKN